MRRPRPASLPRGAHRTPTTKAIMNRALMPRVVRNRGEDRRSMSRQIVLLRGINLGARNRIAMPELRELLASAGFDDVRTYLQSGHVVLWTTASPEQFARDCERRIAGRFGLA